MNCIERRAVSPTGGRAGLSRGAGPVTLQPGVPASTAKAALRTTVSVARHRKSATSRAEVAAAIARAFMGFFDAAPLSSGNQPTVVAIYLSVGNEPGTGPLITVLRRRSITTMVPVLRASRDLDWAIASDDHHVQGLRGTRQPDTPTLGPAAIADATIVLVPALAVDRQGNRLGRGGGSYDRALARVPNDRLVLAVVHDDEVLAAVPTEGHDRPVGGALTPSGVLRFR
jgi:5-formyltetrahydrofolate cyclo-ligase